MAKDPDELLERRDLCNWFDADINPHELIEAKCCNCGAKEADQRCVLQEHGWRLFVDGRLVDAEFLVCNDCANGEYQWEDLY